MRSRALPTLVMNPSWVWLNDVALLTLFFAAWVRLICASKRRDTAVPAASSSGEISFEPEDKRASDLDSIDEDSESKRALLSADVFVLITILTLFREAPRLG